MTDQLLDVVIVGGGQSGLAMARHLARRGLRFVVLEAATEVGHVWRSRWDSLTLFTPAQHDALPGMAFLRRSTDGGVVHRRGVSDVPGLYFLGLSWQHTRGSALLGFVNQDAAYLADQIAAHHRASAPAKAGVAGLQDRGAGRGS